MRLILDTNAVLWALGDTDRLGATHAAVADPANQVYVSVVSSWEIAIKVGLGKLDLPPWLAAWPLGDCRGTIVTRSTSC